MHFDPWANWHPSQAAGYSQDQWGGQGETRPFWRINRRETDGLFKFDGELANYRAWKSRIRDHVSESWPAWRDVLDHAENASEDLTLEKLKGLNVFGG